MLRRVSSRGAFWLAAADQSAATDGGSVRRQLRRILWHQMVSEDDRHDQKWRSQKTAHRPPQPGPECERNEHRQRVQFEPAADNGRRHKMTFEEGESTKSQCRKQASADGAKCD